MKKHIKHILLATIATGIFAASTAKAENIFPEIASDICDTKTLNEMVSFQQLALVITPSPFDTQSLLEEDLDDNRGTAGFDLAIVAASEGLITNNPITAKGDINLGGNMIADNALENAQGIVSIIQNNGINNIIQQSTVVNITFQN